MNRWLLVLSISLIIVGLAGMVVVNAYLFEPFGLRQRRGFTRGPSLLNQDFSSSGQQIYYTGTSRKSIISTSRGPVWFKMHGGGCVQCHWADGKGGKVTTMMGSFTAHDIRFDSLIKGKPAYTEKKIKSAVTRGIDQKGQRLSPNMPRWDIASSDINNLIDFLKTLYGKDVRFVAHGH